MESLEIFTSLGLLNSIFDIILSICMISKMCILSFHFFYLQNCFSGFYYLFFGDAERQSVKIKIVLSNKISPKNRLFAHFFIFKNLDVRVAHHIKKCAADLSQRNGLKGIKSFTSFFKILPYWLYPIEPLER